MKVCSEIFLEFYWLELNFGVFRLNESIYYIFMVVLLVVYMYDFKLFVFWFLFFRIFKLIGFFVIMIYKMLLGDFLWFGIIYVIFFIGFI